MKKLLFSLLLCPFMSTAQDPTPRFVNDTLYTSSGYTIFRGATLEFAKGTAKDGKFRFIKPKNGFLSKSLTNSSVIVKELKHFSTTVLGNGYIDITGYIILKDNSREYIVLHMAFDKAIENAPDLPSELVVPAEFRNKLKRNIDAEIDKMEKLYDERVITREEYEAIKKKLIKQ